MAAAEPRTCYRHPDRETGLSCSECGRPICYECMTPAPVGIRCPEHSGKPQGVRRVQRGVRRASYESTGALVTRLLIAVNVGIYVLTVVQGFGVNSPGGEFFRRTILFGPSVAAGDWWRLITAAFLHGSVVHLAFNMFALYFIGTPVELLLGRGRYLTLYFVSALAGSAGALLQAPLSPVVGASGAIFGILGAMLVIEWQQTGSLRGNAMTLIVINFVIVFFYSNISWGGHLGGLVGGILVMLAFTQWGRHHGGHARLTPSVVGAIVAVGVVSIVIAEWAARTLT